MIIAEFTVDHPVLGEILDRVPDVEVEWLETYERDDGPPQMVFWAENTDFDAVDDALAADPAVENPIVLTELGDRRLYRVDFTELGDRTNLMPTLMETGGVLLRARGSSDGWRCRAQFPGRAAYEQLYRFCRDHDIPFEFHGVYDRSRHRPDDEGLLTEPQREVLRAAEAAGYLDVPRDATLAEVSERIGLSESAASERFRRAVKALVDRAL